MEWLLDLNILILESVNTPILLFDGYCNLCTSSVQFILKHEKNQLIQFASLQSKMGIDLLKQYGVDNKNTDSLVFIENNMVHIKSSAALRLTKYLKGLYPALNFFLIVPSFIRNAMYDFVARNRYKWFGKTETCMMPTVDLKTRFLN